jgi:hypothetical protein
MGLYFPYQEAHMPSLALDYMTEDYVAACHAKAIQEAWKPAVGDYWTICCNLDVTRIESPDDLEGLVETLAEVDGVTPKWIPTKEQAAQFGFEIKEG